MLIVIFTIFFHEIENNLFSSQKVNILLDNLCVQFLIVCSCKYASFNRKQDRLGPVSRAAQGCSNYWFVLMVVRNFKRIQNL